MGELFAAFGVEWNLLIAQSINFLIVFGGLTFFLYKPIMRAVTEREEKVAKGLSDAEASRVDREGIEAEKTSILSSAQKESENIVSRGEDEGKKERMQIVKKAQERAEAALQDARLQGEELKRAALAESEKEIARVTILAAEKIMRKES